MSEVIDITGYTYEQFVDFLFDHAAPHPRASVKPDPWYFGVDVVFDEEEVAKHYLRLFSDPVSVVKRFTPEQLDQGFWAIHGGGLECSVSDLISGPQTVPMKVRHELILAMFDLFQKLGAIEPRTGEVSLWWDSLSMWWDGVAGRGEGPMRDVMFETLKRILALPQEVCQECALHGLGHLRHPDTAAAIEEFLSNTDVTDELREYAVAASRFEIL